MIVAESNTIVLFNQNTFAKSIPNTVTCFTWLSYPFLLSVKYSGYI